MLDFSNAEDQREISCGPVPAGSVVILEMKVLEPYIERQAPDNPLVSVARSGLRQIYCQFEVLKGRYAGVMFRQNITLPAAAQEISLGENMIKACGIGASQLKAICLAAGKPPRIQHIQELSGRRFPARLRIANRPREVDGQEFWNNEIALVITPEKPEYEIVRRDGEIINEDGAVMGRPPREKPVRNSGEPEAGWHDKFMEEHDPFREDPEADEVPFS